MKIRILTLVPTLATLLVLAGASLAGSPIVGHWVGPLSAVGYEQYGDDPPIASSGNDDTELTALSNHGALVAGAYQGVWSSRDGKFKVDFTKFCTELARVQTGDPKARFMLRFQKGVVTKQDGLSANVKEKARNVTAGVKYRLKASGLYSAQQQ